MEAAPRWGMAFDLARCTGCHACSVACKVENQVPLGNFRTKVYYHDKGTFPKVSRRFLPVVCQQCEDAPCLNACPTRSIRRDGDGVVRIDTNTCDAQGECQKACPYGAIYVDPQRMVADKCDFCSNRLSHGMEPACVETCPGETIVFGDLNDPGSKISRFLSANSANLTVLKADQGTKPQVHYRGLDQELERKVPAGHNHSPRSYECETWASLEPGEPALPAPKKARKVTKGGRR